MRWAGHVTYMEEKNAYVESWWEIQKKRDYYEDVDLSERIILKWILER
jgi:hypothetical protein